MKLSRQSKINIVDGVATEMEHIGIPATFFNYIWTNNSNFNVICDLNVLFIEDVIPITPTHGGYLDAESAMIKDVLVALNKNYLLTTDSQPYREEGDQEIGMEQFPYLQCAAKYENMVTLVQLLKEQYQDTVKITFFTKNLSVDRRTADLGQFDNYYYYRSDSNYTGLEEGGEFLDDEIAAVNLQSKSGERNNGFFDDIYCIVINNFLDIYSPPIAYDLKRDMILMKNREVKLAPMEEFDGRAIDSKRNLTVSDLIAFHTFDRLDESIKEKYRNQLPDGSMIEYIKEQPYLADIKKEFKLEN